MSRKRKEGPAAEGAGPAKRKKSETAAAAVRAGKEAKTVVTVGDLHDAYRKSLTPFYQTASDLLTSSSWELYLQLSAYQRLEVDFMSRVEVSVLQAEEEKQPQNKVADLKNFQNSRAVMEKYVGKWQVNLELASSKNAELRELYLRALASIRCRVEDVPDDKKLVRVQFDLDAFAFAARHEFRIAPSLRHLMNTDPVSMAPFIQRFWESTKAMSAETFVIRKSLWKRIRCIQEIGALDSVVRYHVTKWANDHRVMFQNRRRDSRPFAMAIDTIHKQHPFSKLHELYIKLDKDLTASMKEVSKDSMLVVRKVV